jgi:Tfp pilus assembly protein PilW
VSSRNLIPVKQWHHRDDAGLSLIELVVAIVVSMIVFAGIATVLVNSWLAQKNVLSTSEATNRGQIVSSSIERAMRNALYFEVHNSGSELWVRTTFDKDGNSDGVVDDDRHCQMFQIVDGVAAMKSSNADVDLDAWGSWLDVTNYDAFVVNVTTPSAGAFGQTPTTGVGTTLTYDFSVRTDSAPVKFSGQASIRAGEVGNGGCW